MKKSLAIIVVLLIPAGLLASEVMTSARQLSRGRVSAVAYYTNIEQEADFGTRGDFDFVGDALVGKVTVKVLNSWHVFAKVGKFGADLEQGSTKYKKTDDFDGALFGLGVKYNLFPDTIVTPAISVDFGVTGYSIDFSKYDGLNSLDVLVSNSSIDNELESLEFQGTVYMSKKFFALEPYGGLKIIKNDFEWKDNDPAATDTKIEGDTTGVSPFLGVRFNFRPSIGLTLEGSLLAEKSFAVGLTVGF